jgi:hypothetical protein
MEYTPGLPVIESLTSPEPPDRSQGGLHAELLHAMGETDRPSPRRLSARWPFLW